jgi:NAD(P)-dependent dehydrogenase (short-subunit alcohol dehydrogenase family)
MTGGLVGKVVVVSGGTSGIGLAVARRVARDGGAVVIGARRTGPGQDAVAAIRADGGRALFVPADATVEEDAAALVDAAVDRFGRLDGAVNNAGGVRATGPLHELDADEWRAELDHNLTSVFFGLKYQVPAILEAGGGSIVNNASLGGVRGIPGLAAYAAAKHGVIAITKQAAIEHGEQGIRAFGVEPGFVLTEKTEATGRAAKYAAHFRPATPDVIGRCIRWLVTEPAEADELLGTTVYAQREVKHRGLLPGWPPPKD